MGDAVVAEVLPFCTVTSFSVFSFLGWKVRGGLQTNKSLAFEEEKVQILAFLALHRPHTATHPRWASNSWSLSSPSAVSCLKSRSPSARSSSGRRCYGLPSPSSSFWSVVRSPLWNH